MPSRQGRSFLTAAVLLVATLIVGHEIPLTAQSSIEIERRYVQFKQTNADADLRDLISTSTFLAESANAPPAIKTHVTETILLLQRQYERGNLPPITEEKLVQIFNKVMVEAGAPDWAQTSARQFRQLRMAIAEVEPSFISEGMLQNRTNLKEISHEMSPIQAAHLISQLLLEKLVNADYQSNDPNWTLPVHPELAKQLKAAGGAMKTGETQSQTSAGFSIALSRRGSDVAAAIAFINAISDSLQQ